MSSFNIFLLIMKRIFKMQFH